MKPSPAIEPDDPFATKDEATRRTLALLWLADAAPLTAAPADALSDIRSRLSLTAVPARRRPWRLLAIAGWAAAACLAVLLWQRSSSNNVQVPGPASKENLARKIPAIIPSPSDAPPSAPATTNDGTVLPLTDPGELRRQLAELRAAINAGGEKSAGMHRPVIQELRPPGSTAPAASHDHVLDLIATALEFDLRRRSAAAADGRELIIESGWANWSSALPADTTFRHRQFPAGNWTELGLLKGANGQFFDPATGWLWTPDPDSTDYTGRAAPAGLDRTQFIASDNPVVEKSQPAATPPAGYLLTAEGGETIVALSNLPAVPLGASLRMTSYDASGDDVSFTVASTASVSDGWNFSGIIPAGTDTDLTRGFSIELEDARGSRSVILSSH